MFKFHGNSKKSNASSLFWNNLIGTIETYTFSTGNSIRCFYYMQLNKTKPPSGAFERKKSWRSISWVLNFHAYTGECLIYVRLWAYSLAPFSHNSQNANCEIINLWCGVNGSWSERWTDRNVVVSFGTARRRFFYVNY